MSNKHLNELHWKDEYNGKMIQRNVETGKLYILPWDYEIKLNLETGEYITAREKEAWKKSDWPTINQLRDVLEVYEPTLVGVVRREISPQVIHNIAKEKWNVDIPVKYFEWAMDGWISNRSAGKQYIRVGNDFMLYAPSSLNHPRVEIHKYFPNCEWMQTEGEV